MWGPGGDYRPGVGANRTAQEQHPFHMHGHHFWVLAHGLGTFNEATNRSAFNTVNPPFRDSYTIFKNGWTAIRFKVRRPLLSPPAATPIYTPICPHLHPNHAPSRRLSISHPCTPIRAHPSTPIAPHLHPNVPPCRPQTTTTHTHHCSAASASLRLLRALRMKGILFDLEHASSSKGAYSCRMHRPSGKWDVRLHPV